MKFSKIGILFLMIVLIWGCDTKSETSIDDITLPEERFDSVEVVKPRRTYTLDLQNKWMKYYSDQTNGFGLSNFKKEGEFDIIRNKSEMNTPIWDKDFKTVYKQFLAFNADSTKYVDIDSYKWGFDDKGELIVGPDQEIVLVNIPEKKVERILFYGPSFWVEDAYFKNDSIVVLLENSTDKLPAYQEINIYQNKSNYYIYKKPLDFESEYLKNRIMDIYKNPM